jgi:hypothetical protein
MKVLFQLTRIKFIEMAINILFNSFKSNLMNYNHDIILPKDLLPGMKIKEIQCKSLLMEGAVYKDCTILENNRVNSPYNTGITYEIVFQFEDILNTPFTLGANEDPIDTIYVGERSEGFVFVKW